MQDTAFALSVGSFTFLIAVIWGGPFLELLRLFKIGKINRVELNGIQDEKVGTPTMGGFLIIFPVLIVTIGLNLVNLLVPDISGRSILVPLAVLVYFGALGAWDDWEGLRGTRAVGEGLSARLKFIAQVLGAVAAAVAIAFVLELDFMLLPGVPVTFELGILYVPIAALIIVGTSNAVNLTDGMDGLAGIITASAFAAYGVIALLQGQVFLTQFCFTMVGACFAFLWFNAHPAQLFMGDTGSLALGATLATVALMTGQWIILPVIAIIPMAETISVILQVASARYSRRYLGEDRRIFKMAPLHYHFKLLGWSETQVVQRFWLVGILAGMFGVALALL
ncbi:MAG: phospho-N-acetylmuramoyl-pentapeptide-transferase [Chloroflexi bacterium]|nr:phospho-N-acetylmuramoyl-pentapeptide-transferase [Chloroflexota bacterium]